MEDIPRLSFTERFDRTFLMKHDLGVLMHVWESVDGPSNRPCSINILLNCQAGCLKCNGSSNCLMESQQFWKTRAGIDHFQTDINKINIDAPEVV